MEEKLDLEILSVWLILKFKNLLRCEDRDLLDNLINTPKVTDSQINRYQLTLLKKINQSTKPGKIKESVNDFSIIKTLYQQINPIIDEQALSLKAIRHYAM